MEFSKSTTSEKLSNEYFFKDNIWIWENFKGSFMIFYGSIGHKSHLCQIVTCMLNAVASQYDDHYDFMLEQ